MGDAQKKCSTSVSSNRNRVSDGTGGFVIVLWNLCVSYTNTVSAVLKEGEEYYA